MLNQIGNWLSGEQNNNAISEKSIKNRFAEPQPSFSDQLAIVDFCDEQNLFLLNDGISIGSGFELASIPAEATSPEHLESVFNKI